MYLFKPQEEEKTWKPSEFLTLQMRRTLSQIQLEKEREVDNLNILNSFLNINIWMKIILLLLISLYTIFSFVIFNQVRAMNKIIYVPSSSQILFITSIIHSLLAISLFLTALVIL